MIDSFEKELSAKSNIYSDAANENKELKSNIGYLNEKNVTFNRCISNCYF